MRLALIIASIVLMIVLTITFWCCIRIGDDD